MNNEHNNMDDLFDDNIGKSLRQLGYVFPQTTADFKHIENLAKKQPLPQPDRLKDPYQFLGKRSFKSNAGASNGESLGDYSSNLSQAAREGRNISDDIKAKMAQDKLKASQKKKDE